ncbi:PAS domain-containing protein (plasmid) [Rhizobium leguminosarum bv. trifolii]|nr:PAS domain-containing protein [Rhizobium leguminosarum bv. trifolii]
MPLRNAKTAEKKLQLLEVLLGTGVWTYDLQTRDVVWSAGLFRLLGFDPNSIVASLDLYDSLVHPDDRLTHEEVVEMAKAGELAVRRFRVIRPDGHLIWLESRTERQYDRQGRLAMLHGVIQDVTDQEKVRSEQARLASINNSMRKITGADFWRADTEGKLLDFTNWMRFTGQTPEQLKDYGSLSAVHPDDRDLFTKTWQSGIALKQRIELSVRVRRHDGAYQRFKNSVVPVIDADGAILEWHGMSWVAEDAPSTPRTAVALQSAHVRAARALLDISAQQLAEMSQVSFSTIRRMEADASAVRQDSIDQVQAALGRRGVQFLQGQNGHISVALSPV